MASNLHNPCFSISIFILIISTLTTGNSNRKSNTNLNAIDNCWRRNPLWARNRQQLAACSVGFAGKMQNNVGDGLIRYHVTDASDNPINPKPGTLRYGATSIKGKVWITFKSGFPMQIKLLKPLLISSFTTIDGRGANVNIANGACFLLYKVTDVIIHGLQFHQCRSQGAGQAMGPDSKLVDVATDGDAIRLVESRKIWIDHNTLSMCEDGLVDVTRGSTEVTISNNRFINHDKVMLLGHDDTFVQDRNMRVTVVYNHFGPNCNQRMPRVRHGYAHVVNNLYEGWQKYAIGGSMNPSITSQANLFVAATSSNKQVTWGEGQWSENVGSVKDEFENGAQFSTTTENQVINWPHYNTHQNFYIADAQSVRLMTNLSGALRCSKKSRC